MTQDNAQNEQDTQSAQDKKDAQDAQSAPREKILALLETAVEALGGAPRPGQQRMAEAVSAAMQQEHHLAVQAGTGTGKSLAYLVPAMDYATRTDKPVIVSTATIALQRQLVERDLPRLAKALKPHLPRAMDYAILKGRSNYLCLNKLHNSAEGVEGTGKAGAETNPLLGREELTFIGKQILAIREWAEKTTDGDRDSVTQGVSEQAWRQVSVSSRECIGASNCAYGEQCFAEAARAKAQSADVVVTNHALLAIDSLSENSVLPEHDVVVVDEAHELEGRVTAVATNELSPSAVHALVKRAEKLLTASSSSSSSGSSSANSAGSKSSTSSASGSELTVTERLDTAADEWRKTLQQAERTHGEPLRRKWQGVPELFVLPLTTLRDELWALHRSLTALEASEESKAERHGLLATTEELHDTVVRILETASSDNSNANTNNTSSTNSNSNAAQPDDDVVWLADDDRLSVYVAPLSVSDILAQDLFAQSTVILTSATLALGGKFSAMLAAWGLAKNTTTLDVGTPFQTRSHGILYTATHLPIPGQDSASDVLVDEVAQLINAAGGRTLGLFSSRRAAEDMAMQLRTLSPYPILLQGEDSLSQLVEQFRAEPETCLFGTLSLWQGVDVPGESLQLVIIDRIPFPRPNDPLMQARKEAADAAGRRGFMEVSAHHAALLMAQGAGRLLRSVEDKGVVAVLDPRLKKPSYGSYIRASMPDFWETSDPAVVHGALRRLRNA